VPLLLIFAEAESTNDIARAHADAGAPAGSLVMAEYQSAGRGRMGREWSAPPGSGLLLSFVLRPAASRDAAPGSLPLRIGLAAARAVRTTTGAQLRVKWPNDLVTTTGAKVGGILCEAYTGTASDSFVIAGIGINVRAREWPLALRQTAAALDDVTGATSDRVALMRAIAGEMRSLFTAPLLPLTRSELSEFDGLDALKGRDITVQQASATMRATAEGIDADGALRILGANGSARVTSATVRIADNATTGSTP
jgi:BirA family biotin operon repressor/biotin-[acetyl-CoA-carboxylase] ligase